MQRSELSAILIGLVALEPGLALAAPPQRPDGVHVLASVERTDDGHFAYEYVMLCPPEMADTIVRVELDVTREERDADLPVPPGGFAADAYPRGARVIPVAAAAPDGWSTGLGTLRNRPGRGWLMWVTGHPATTLRPGSWRRGFRVVSRGLPSLRTMQLKPDFNTALMPRDVVADFARIETLRDETTAVVMTVGPAAPPVLTSPSDRLEFLARTVDSLRLLRWIRSADAADTMRATLAIARQHYAAGEAAAAREAVVTFQRALTAAACADPFCTPGVMNHEAYVVLFFWTEHLLGEWNP